MKRISYVRGTELATHRSMTLANKFNRSAFGRWINSPAGRAFRVLAGSGFAIAGLRYRHTAGGKAALMWSFFPLSAGGLDICWISAALGGPLRGEACRADAAQLPPPVISGPMFESPVPT